jgi:Flp pilus assembly protein TadG
MIRMSYVRFGRARRRASDVKRRRGAVLVMTAAAMAGLMVVTAFAVDLSRLYVLRTELQTAADAAALAAAMRLNDDWGRAESSARSAVHDNPSLAGEAEVDAVRFGAWDAEDRTFTSEARLESADAVQVTVGRTTTYLFARFVSDGPIRLTARATAWAGAPVKRAECVKPWFILHQDFMRAIGRAIGDDHPDLTHADVRRLRDTTPGHRVEMRLRLKYVKDNPKPNLQPNLLYGMELPTPYSGESPKKTPTFRENVEGCNRMEQLWVAKTVRGDTAATNSWAGVKELCQSIGPKGECYNSKGGVGVPITVSIFCTGPEHTGGEMWFQTEWMTGFMVTETHQEPNKDFILKGYLIVMQSIGKLNEETKVTGLVRTILVE